MASVLLGCGRDKPRTDAFGYRLTILAEPSDDSVDISPPLTARLMPNGMLYVLRHASSKAQIIVLDSSARFVQNFGRQGKGPGEFTAPTFVIPRGDSLVVGNIDGQVSIFDSTRKYVRTLRQRLTGVPNQVVRLRGDTLVFAFPGSSPENFGYPLHLVSPDGTPGLSFGSNDRTIRKGYDLPRYRVIAAETDSTLWVARLDRYSIERWTSGGRLIDTLALRRSWFPPLSKNFGQPQYERPVTHVVALHQESDGHLLVLIERARADWQPEQVPSNPLKESGRPYVFTDRMKYVEQVIEIVDANSGVLLGRASGLPGFRLLHFLDDGRIFGIREADDGRQIPILARLQREP